jgi:hypothetical protein
MAELRAVPKMISECLGLVVEPFLTSQRLGGDVSRILDHYDSKILGMDEGSLHDLSIDVLTVLGYDVISSELSHDQTVTIVRRVPPGVELNGRAVVRSITLKPGASAIDSEVLDIWLDSQPNSERSLTVGTLSAILLLLTLPSYVNEFLNTFRAFPGLRQELDRLASARLTWRQDEIAEIVEAGYALAGVGPS